MIAEGATTLWEGLRPRRDRRTNVTPSMADPSARSLCPRLGLGAAVALLVRTFRPENRSSRVGRRSRFSPVASSLAWAAVCIPTPAGFLRAGNSKGTRPGSRCPRVCAVVDAGGKTSMQRAGRSAGGRFTFPAGRRRLGVRLKSARHVPHPGCLGRAGRNSADREKAPRPRRPKRCTGSSPGPKVRGGAQGAPGRAETERQASGGQSKTPSHGEKTASSRFSSAHCRARAQRSACGGGVRTWASPFAFFALPPASFPHVQLLR